MKIPWYIKLFGIGWLRNLLTDRILHVPDSELAIACSHAGVTPTQWRMVEAEQAQRALAQL